MSNYLCIQMSFKIQWVLFRTWIHELEIKREWFITLSLLIILYVSEEIYIKISQLSMSFNKTIMWMCRFPKRYTIPKLLLSLIPPPKKKPKKKEQKNPPNNNNKQTKQLLKFHFYLNYLNKIKYRDRSLILTCTYPSVG